VVDSFVGLGGTLLPLTKVTTAFEPLGTYCPDTGTVPPVLTFVAIMISPILSGKYVLQPVLLDILRCQSIKTKQENSLLLPFRQQFYIANLALVWYYNIVLSKQYRQTLGIALADTYSCNYIYAVFSCVDCSIIS